MCKKITKRFILLALCTMHYALCTAFTDPTLAGMIVVYTDKAEKQLKSQEAAMLMETTGHIWIREETEATTSLQRQFNDYLDSFRSIVCYAAQIYGFYHEISAMTDNLSTLTTKIGDAPSNAVAVALSSRRNHIYREVILGSVEICNDIRQVCFSDIKMTEKERVEVVFAIRPKLKLLNQKLRRLILAVKYTTLQDVWNEIDDRQRSYEVDKAKIGNEAFRRWRSCGGGRLSSGSGGIIRPDWPSGRFPVLVDSIHQMENIR